MAAPSVVVLWSKSNRPECNSSRSTEQSAPRPGVDVEDQVTDQGGYPVKVTGHAAPDKAFPNYPEGFFVYSLNEFKHSYCVLGSRTRAARCTFCNAYPKQKLFKGLLVSVEI